MARVFLLISMTSRDHMLGGFILARKNVTNAYLINLSSMQCLKIINSYGITLAVQSILAMSVIILGLGIGIVTS